MEFLRARKDMQHMVLIHDLDGRLAQCHEVAAPRASSEENLTRGFERGKKWAAASSKVKKGRDYCGINWLYVVDWTNPRGPSSLSPGGVPDLSLQPSRAPE